MRYIAGVFVLLSGSLVSATAFADPVKYCESYAKDAADLRIGAAVDASIVPASGGDAATDADTEAVRLEWERVRDSALKDCLVQFDAAPEAAPKRKVQTRQAKLALKPGTAAWNAYCAAKYVSFRPQKGTYTAMSGKERPCQVD
jgi:hypothetical protein